MYESASHQFNQYSPSLRVNPFPIYARFQRNLPVCQVQPEGFWLVSGYENAVYVLKNPGIFSSVNSARLSLQELTAHNCIPDFPLIFDDPPRHTQLRRSLNKKLLRDYIANEAGFIRATADRLLSALKECEQKTRKQIDFFSDFICPYLDRIIIHANGFEGVDDLSVIHDFMTAVEHPPMRKATESYYANLQALAERKDAFVTRLLQSQLENPGSELMWALIREKEGGVLSQTEFFRLFELMSLLAFMTLRHFLSHVVMQLAHNRGMLARLAASPEHIPLFIEEVLRFDSSVHFLFRNASCDTRLSGVTLPSGAPVMVNVAAANRDPAFFADPDRFDIDRQSPKKHIAFGYGVHNCFGSELARVSSQIMVETLVGRIQTMSCPDKDKLPWFYSWVAHGVKSLPVTFTYRD
ncbi:MAG: cytochrome P450 [Exilibacterium sp.]